MARNKGVKSSGTIAVAVQTIEMVGGPFDGEVYRYEYATTPLFFIIITSGETGANYEYRMCSDAKFRLMEHADSFDGESKRARKRGKR